MRRTKLSKKDQKLIRHLKDELKSYGVLDDESKQFEKFSQTADELDAMIKEAQESAKSEKELNPSSYQPDVEEFLEEDEAGIEDWENPALDGVDDDGTQWYDNHLRDKNGNTVVSKDKETKQNRIVVNQESDVKTGRKVTIKLPDDTDLPGNIL